MEAGQRLAHYSIVRPLGRGGMGEVYVAQDTKLNRQVALKLLPREMASDVERLERFRREAQAVAALNHPNIVTIHSVEEADGVHFITLELVEGQTLDKLIPAGGVSIEKFFNIAIPLVDAVAAAHDRGVVHRDLKPANVMVTADDRVKVLDFGLAKLLEPDPKTKAGAETAMAGEHLTGEGKILGTVAYMSPEQAEAKPLDHRTDIFSLGVILYQLATGELPFKGDTQMSILSSILRDAPASVTGLKAQLPRHLGRIIHKALEKPLNRRYQTALDLRNDLDELKHEIDTGEIVLGGTAIRDPEAVRRVPAQRRTSTLPVAIAVIALLLVAGAAWWLGWIPRAGGPPTVTSARQITTTRTDAWPTVSPDGQWIAFARFQAQPAPEIFLQSLGDQRAVQLTKGLGAVGTPAFSPDGTSIAFCSLNGAGGIFVMGRMGGNVRRLTDRGYNPAWSPDGKRIAFALEFVFGNPFRRNNPLRQLVIVDVATGQQTETGIQDAVQPAWSPHGQRIAFWGVDEQAWRDIYTASADGGKPVRVTRDVHVDHSPAWSPDGRWLYFVSTRGGPMGIWRVGIDERTGEPDGEPQQVTVGGLTEPAFLSFSADGRRLMYQEALVQTRIDRADFDPVTLRAAPKPQSVLQGSRRLIQLDVSADGKWLAYRTEDARQDVYIARDDGSEQQQVTNDDAKDWMPRWSPDAKRLTFYSNASGRYQIWVTNRDGSGRIRLTDAKTGNTYDPIWSPDGTEIVYLESAVDSYIVKSNVPFDKQTPRVVPRMKNAAGNEVRIRASDWSGVNGQVAADGPRLYSPATGALESLVQGPGIVNPRWMQDGRRLYYQRGSNWVVLDTKTRTERTMELPTSEDPIEELVLSPDGRRVYLLFVIPQIDIWQLEIK
jgi:Tol biopolymer transport system component